MGHLGLTPQSVNQFGGYTVQGREAAQAETFLTDAKALEQAGAFSLVLEAVPTALAQSHYAGGLHSDHWDWCGTHTAMARCWSCMICSACLMNLSQNLSNPMPISKPMPFKPCGDSKKKSNVGSFPTDVESYH